MPNQTYPGVDARLVSIVRIKCNRLVGRYGIRTDDLEEFRQEWISAAIQAPEYQDRKHPQFTTFIGRIIDRLIIAEIRRRKAEKRHYKAIAFSLDEYINQSEEDSTWHDAISEEDYLQATGGSFTDHRTAAATRQDLEGFVQSLPEELKELARHLRHYPMERIPELTGISRATAFRRLQKLREAATEYFPADW